MRQQQSGTPPASTLPTSRRLSLASDSPQQTAARPGLACLSRTLPRPAGDETLRLEALCRVPCVSVCREGVNWAVGHLCSLTGRSVALTQTERSPRAYSLLTLSFRVNLPLRKAPAAPPPGVCHRSALTATSPPVTQAGTTSTSPKTQDLLENGPAWSHRRETPGAGTL